MFCAVVVAIYCPCVFCLRCAVLRLCSIYCLSLSRMCVACTVRYVLGCMCGTILDSCLCSMHSLIALAVLCIALSYLSDVMCCACAVQYSVCATC